MRVRVAVMTALVVVAGFGIPVNAAPRVTLTQLGTSASPGMSGPIAVACWSAGNCVATGYAPNNRATVQTQRDGKWGLAVDATRGLGKISYSILVTASCFSGGCLAFGRYLKSQNNPTDAHFTISYSHGLWKKASELSLQLGSAKAFQEFSLSCRDPGDCVVVGTLRYSAENASIPVYAPALLTEKSGRWGRPVSLAPKTSGVNKLAELLDVSCPTWGECRAVGIGTMRGAYRSILAVQTDGHWSMAQAGFPANWSVLSISCPSLRNCTVGGRISTPNGSEAFVATGGVGHWGNPIQVGKRWTISGYSRSSANLLSCQSASTCVVAGQVDGPRPTVNSTLGVSSVAWVASEIRGRWTDGTLIGYRRVANNQGQVSGLSCPSVGNCEGVGQYWSENASLRPNSVTHNFAASIAR